MDYASGIRFPDHSKLAINLKINNNVIIQSFSDVVLYLLSSVPIFISISILVLELRQFLFTKDLTRQSENECIHV